MHANDLLEYRDKIIDAFKDRAFSYVLQDVDSFIQKTESMSEKINWSLFENFFELLPVDYARRLINVKNADKNKGIVAEAKDRIPNLKDIIKNEQKRKQI